MIQREFDGVSWLEFELLAGEAVIHGCFSRIGGCSVGPLASLNIGRSVGDLPENVAANYAKIGKTLSLEVIIPARLVHGADVAKIEGPNHVVPAADSVMTDRLMTGLSVSQADCQAAIFYDPVNHAIANVHCGWRGSVKNVYRATVEAMQAAYGTMPRDLLVGISPSLGPDSSQFINYREELPQSFWEYQHRPLYFNFWEISKRQLRDAGVLPHHIQIAGIDTYQDENYFSHRRMRQGGRQATVCALRKDDRLK